MGVRDLAQSIAYVPQEHKPVFQFRVLDMVIMGRNPHVQGLLGYSAEDKRIALQSLEKLGIRDLAAMTMKELSGGQKQLVLIARALTQNAPLMILDEPTSSLDYSNQIKIWEMLEDIAKSGQTIIACTHDPNHVLWFCNRTIVLHEGRVIAEGSPKTVLTSDLLSHVYKRECIVGSYETTSLVIPRFLYS